MIDSVIRINLCKEQLHRFIGASMFAISALFIAN